MEKTMAFFAFNYLNGTRYERLGVKKTTTSVMQQFDLGLPISMGEIGMQQPKPPMGESTERKGYAVLERCPLSALRLGRCIGSIEDQRHLGGISKRGAKRERGRTLPQPWTIKS